MNSRLKGINVWILGFFSLLSGANVVNAVIMWFDRGPIATFTPYLLGGLTGPIPIYVYLLLSLLILWLFLGITVHMAVSELSAKDQIATIDDKANRLEAGQQNQQNVLESMQARVFLVDEGVERTRSELSRGIVDQGKAVRESLEAGQQTQQKSLDGMQGRVFLVEESLRSLKKGLSEQTEAIRGVDASIVEKVGPQLSDVREALAQIEQRDRKTVAAIADQRAEINDIVARLERMENSLVKTRPQLTSQSNVDDVKGIGPGKGTELKEIGITNVGDLIMADPKVVADRMGSTEKTVEKLQGRAQLLMVPGIKDKDLLLLEELGINDRKSLAEQDPIELSKKINAIFKVNVARGKVTEADKPTIEDIDSWVKFVRA